MNYPVRLWLRDGVAKISPGTKLECGEPAEHGDWKTAAAHPGRWPTLRAGTPVEVVSVWMNFYGVQVKVRAPNGEEYDLPQHVLEAKGAE